jgi:hypothetical protein
VLERNLTSAVSPQQNTSSTFAPDNRRKKSKEMYVEKLPLVS